ncbi:MAG: TIGR01459 family HAD-type hydrolase [Pseudomonadota bacterium]
MTYEDLSLLFDRYEAFLIDQFGVLLSGTGPYPGAQVALAGLAKRGKPVVILSNSGKRSEVNTARLVQHGFERRHFETVLTSGEVAYNHLRQMLGAKAPERANAYVVLRDGDQFPFLDLPLQRTTDPEATDILLLVNRDPMREIASYEPILQRLAARQVPCLCTNPDFKMLTPNGTTESAGYFAQMYEAFGGSVRWFGKPHQNIYDCAYHLLKGIDRGRVLCVGDSLDHDIAGGASAGFKTALVRTGIHEELSDTEFERAVASSRFVPDYVLSGFSQ